MGHGGRAVDAQHAESVAVEMRGICKVFGSLKALDEVDLTIKKGTIHALLGENGAGKSTLMKILYGFYQKDKGAIFVNGQAVDIRNPKIAIQHGIGMVHQHFMLVENFTIAENIVLGSEPTRSFGRLDYAKTREAVETFSRKYGLEVNPDARIQDVSVATQQRVEILKALYRGIDILILDEPTAVLTPQEIVSLIDTLRRLVKDGKTVIIITHKLKEIQAAAEFCTIIRRGKVIDTVRVADVTQVELANMMVGHEVRLETDKAPAQPGVVVFSLNEVRAKDSRGVEKVKGLSLDVKAGEILAVAGVDGNGQTELVDVITGLARAESGSIKMCGEELLNASPFKIQQTGIKTIHEDRQKRGLVLDFTVGEDMILETYRDQTYARHGFLNWKKIYKETEELIRRFDIRPANAARLPARGLSGGNQQKVIIAREISQEPKLLIACQPTRGLDVGAIEYVRRALVEQRDQGKAVLLISLELDEVLDIADRIAVIYDGRIVAMLDPAQTNEQEIGLWMAGGGR